MTVLAALVAAAAAGCPPPQVVPPPPPVRRIVRARWLPGTVITEYWPAPERWFTGRLVRAAGIPGLHRVDWLYGARGLPMEGEGIGRDGRVYHFAGPWDIGWVNRAGAPTVPCRRAPGYWTSGRPFWVRSPGRAVFAAGHSRTLAYWRSAAVDRRLIPFGSRIFVPAYCGTPARGWLEARDTGGAIIGPHIDVYRPPPAARPAGRSWGRLLRGQKIFVVPPGATAARLPRCD
jgi:3D (Asp-Asp-Asp) domain-containing protein